MTCIERTVPLTGKVNEEYMIADTTQTSSWAVLPAH